MSPEIIAAIVGLLSSTLVAGLSLFGAKKLGIGTSQVQLIGTLKDITSAQDTRIEQLEKMQVEVIAELAAEKVINKSLQATVIQQALDLAECKRGLAECKEGKV